MLVHDYLEYWARVTPSTACIEDDDGVWTYAEVNARSDRVAEALASLGLVPGDRLAVLSENRVEYLPLYFGAFKAGVVPVPLNYRLHPREWVHIVNDAGARAVIAESRYTAALDSVRPGLDGVGRFVALGESGRGWLAFDQVVGSATGETTDHRVDETADLYQMYTSGTTGRPKGAVLTHRAVDSNIRQTQIVLGLRLTDRTVDRELQNRLGQFVGNGGDADEGTATVPTDAPQRPAVADGELSVVAVAYRGVRRHRTGGQQGGLLANLVQSLGTGPGLAAVEEVGQNQGVQRVRVRIGVIELEHHLDAVSRLAGHRGAGCRPGRRGGHPVGVWTVRRHGHGVNGRGQRRARPMLLRANDVVCREGASFPMSHSIGPASHKCAFDTLASSVALLSPVAVDRTLPPVQPPTRVSRVAAMTVP